MEDHDVGRFDRVRIRGDVVQPPVHASLVHTGLAQEPARLSLVRRRELEVHRARGAALEQLQLDLADAASDLQHGEVLDARALDERDDTGCRLVEPALAVALGHSPGEPRAEEVVTAPSVTAAPHGLEIRDAVRAVKPRAATRLRTRCSAAGL